MERETYRGRLGKMDGQLAGFVQWIELLVGQRKKRRRLIG